MKKIFGLAHLRLATAAIVPLGALGVTAPAFAQSGRLSLPVMPLADALQRIGAQTGVKVVYDPDAVGGILSMPVVDAADAITAVRQATRRLSLSVATVDGSIVVTSDILVVAQRDEAEDRLLVRGATSSDRTGQTLREQPRNTQVISSKLIEEQQAQTIIDALRNAGGVSVNTASQQSGANFSVRGFTSGGIVNGMPGAVANAGSTQPIANIERVEVLKGPDALLAGQGNLGGAINIVTKKPSAETRLSVSAEAGSYGQLRLTGDAGRALNADRTISARVIGAVSTASRNYGRYRGAEEFLFAPSLRFKNATTDLILSASVGEQSFGPTPFVPFNPTTMRPFDVPIGRRLLSVKDQGIQIDTARFSGELTQKVTDWLTVVGKAQHQRFTVAISQYVPLALLSASGTLLLSNGPSRQEANADALDGYARITAKTGPVEHLLVAGYTYVNNKNTVFSNNRSSMFTYNFLTATAPPTNPLLLPNTRDYIQVGTQSGYYAQYLAKIWRLTLSAGARHNKVKSTIQIFTPPPRTGIDQASSTTPNFGAVLDITKDLSLFGTLAYGYSPTFISNRNREKLPDIKTRNAEAGVKLDLLGDRILINASYFKLRQSNLLMTDPAAPTFQMAVPGQQGTGIDLNVSGEIVRGWTVQGSYTRTKYEYLTFSQFGNEVVGQPKHTYSVYSSYRHKFAPDLSAGLGAGVFGRSSGVANRVGTFVVPSARQVDLNTFLTRGRLDANLGVRNIFDRRNYGLAYSTTYIPINEPRTVRLTLSYRLQ